MYLAIIDTAVAITWLQCMALLECSTAISSLFILLAIINTIIHKHPFWSFVLVDSVLFPDVPAVQFTSVSV